jgi:threonine dehydratase
MTSNHPTIDDITAAAARIADVVRVTPLIDGDGLGERLGVPVRLKAECLQETGSFKVRGAANALLSMAPGERARGVVVVSSGNHGRAIAHVARLLDVPATICLSARVPSHKVDAIAALGARIVVGGPDQDDADAAARRLVEEEGLVMVHPFDDPRVIAGQGTIALEVIAAWPETRTLVVPLSGGGLISGVAAAAKALEPGMRVVGVSQDRGPAMIRSLAAGRLVPVVEEDTLADALAGGLGPENHHTFEMCRDLVDEVAVVSEEEIAVAMRRLHRDHGLTVEGGGAVGVAAALAGRTPVAGPTVFVLSGGNVAPATLAAVLAGGQGSAASPA